MKRKRELEEEDSDDDSSGEPPAPDPIPDDLEILRQLQSGLIKDDHELNRYLNDRLFKTQKQYFLKYMEKLMNQIPMGKDVVAIVQDMGEANGFEYMFTAAKSIVQSKTRVQYIKSLHAVFDMVYELVFRYAHEKVVSPALRGLANAEQLKEAYEAYQRYAKSSSSSNELELEMQCLLFNIQEMLDKQGTVKVPNPLYNHFSQKMKAMSEYVVALLMTVSKPQGVPGVGEEEWDPDAMRHHGKEEKPGMKK